MKGCLSITELSPLDIDAVIASLRIGRKDAIYTVRAPVIKALGKLAAQSKERIPYLRTRSFLVRCQYF